MINVDKLSRVFRTDEVETTALNEVSFKVVPGEFVAIFVGADSIISNALDTEYP